MKSAKKRGDAQRSAPRGVPLDATALEAIDRFVRLLARCGCTPEEIRRAFERACERVPRTPLSKTQQTRRELSNASHILTVWFSDPLYLDRSGKPIWLPVRGPAPSLEALIVRVDPALDVTEVVRYLKRTDALRQAGLRYTPRKRALSLRGAEGPEVFRNLRSLVGLLRTLEHNMQPKRSVRSWFEYFAENPAFPLRSRAAFDSRVDELGMKFLHAVDADMHRRELERAPGERTVRMGVGIYRFEAENPIEAVLPVNPHSRLPRGRRRRSD